MAVTAKKKGRRDHMGFAWYEMYDAGKPIIKDGIHLAYKATDEEHAKAMHRQLEGVKTVPSPPAKERHPVMKGQKSIEKGMEKDKLIDSILENGTHMKESGIYQRLFSVLHKLTLHDLRNLDIIISLKRRDILKEKKRTK